MSLSLKKITKAVTKPISKVVSAVGKIAQGNVAEGLGDIGQTAAGVGLDVATGGNKNTADALSGGLLTSAELAARGNSSDAARLGLVGGAAAIGGPGGAIAANSALANGGGPLSALFAASSGSQGGGMDIFSSLNGFLGGDSALSKLALSSLSGLAGGGSKPQPVPVVNSSVDRTYVAPAPAEPTDWKKWGMIGGGAFALILVLVLATGRRGR